MTEQAVKEGGFISTEAMLKHWQGHRALTRKMLEIYPEDQLFTFTIGGMRSFGELILEMQAMAAPMVREVLTGKSSEEEKKTRPSKEEMLHMWDESTREMDDLWPRIPQEKFYEHITVYGQHLVVSDLILYMIDNEVHHRGQAYVYFRALGLQPPDFFGR